MKKFLLKVLLLCLVTLFYNVNALAYDYEYFSIEYADGIVGETPSYPSMCKFGDTKNCRAPQNVYTPENYSFIGWFCLGNCNDNGELHYPGEDISTLGFPDDSIVLEAVYMPTEALSEYTLYFIGRPEDYGEAGEPELVYKINCKFGMPCYIPSFGNLGLDHEGFTPVAWVCDGGACDGMLFSPGEDVGSKLQDLFDTNQVLYALWDNEVVSSLFPVEYTTEDPDAVMVGTPYPNECLYNSGTCIVPENIYDHPNAAFIGWLCSSYTGNTKCEGKIFQPGDDISSVIDPYDVDGVILTALWQSNVSDIDVLIAPTGNPDELLNQIGTCAYGQNYTGCPAPSAPSTQYSPYGPNSTFYGWRCQTFGNDPSCDGRIYQPGEDLSISTNYPELVLEAVWTPSDNLISQVILVNDCAAGETCYAPVPEIFYIKYNVGGFYDKDLNLPIANNMITVPIKDGYTFNGYGNNTVGAAISSTGQFLPNLLVQNPMPATTYLVASWTADSVTCSAGNYLPANSQGCAKCPAKNYCQGGTFVPSASDQGINLCPDGYQDGTTGLTAQNKCEKKVEGSYYIKNARDTKATVCPYWTYKGMHSVKYGETSSCISCPASTNGWQKVYNSGYMESYTDCNQVIDAANYSKYCSGGLLKQYANGQNSWGEVQISETLSAVAGAYVNGQTCTQCNGAVYSAGGTATSCTSCPAQTSGWTRATGTGWTSYTSCYQTKSGTAISSYCSSGTLKQTATSSTTWGATTISSALSAKAGAYVNGQTCSQCTSGYYCTGGTAGQTACVMGSYSPAGASSCIACADGKTTSASGSKSCDATCSNANDSEGEAAVKGWVDATWNTNNTVSNLCKAASCLGGENGHYLSNGNCPRCDSFANGLYPRSSNRGTTKGQDACFLYTADIPGKYIASQKATVATLCQKGTYSAGSSTKVVHYGETSSCNGCPDNTYADEEGLTACKACLENYTTYGEKTSASSCRILCQGGSYIASPNATQCSNVGAGYWAQQAYVTQGNVGTRNMCAAGLTTIGFGSGADEADDCGRVLHIGDGKLYLRSTKKTDLALNVNIGGTTYYGNMSTEDKFMSDGIEKSLKLNVNGTIYSVYDDSADDFFGGGETGLTINPNLTATTIVPASYNEASSLSWSATLSDGTKVSGVGACDSTTAENGDVSAAGFSPSGTGSGCWCKINSPAQGVRYVYGTTNSSCSTKCGYFCANNMKGTSAKNITYRTNLYTTAGISVQ